MGQVASHEREADRQQFPHLQKIAGY
jgi:hypothetical protein